MEHKLHQKGGLFFIGMRKGLFNQGMKTIYFIKVVDLIAVAGGKEQVDVVALVEPTDNRSIRVINRLRGFAFAGGAPL